MTDLVNPFAVELRSMIEDDDPFAAAGKRGRYKRPLVTTPDGEEVEYQRPSSIAKTLDDSGGLLRWGAGMAALGVAEDPELAGFLRSVDTSLPGWKKVIYDYGDRAKESASANTGADYGSLIHQLCAHRELGTTPTFDIPAGVAGAVDAYMDEKERLGIETVVVEFTIVNDRLRFAGTVDRLYRLPSGELVIGDLKGLPLETPIPTPSGWSTMGELKVGDEVFGRDGQPCTVTHKSRPKEVALMRITFDDKTEIIADVDHRWAIHKPYGKGADEVMTTAEMAADLRGPSGQRWLTIPNAKPLNLDDADLPIDPYVLGAWLGDGTTADGKLTNPLPEVWMRIQQRGFKLGSPTGSPTCPTMTVLGLRTGLRENGLLGHKHIPAAYLRASEAQRRDLLAGLMDTDGSFNIARNECVYYTTSKELAQGVDELLLSLGYRTTVWSGQRTGFGLTVDCFDVKFRPHDGVTPFIAKRRQFFGAHGMTTAHRSSRRLVYSVEPLDVDGVTQCIAVDSDDHTYLCGRQMVPTHNTNNGRQEVSWAIQCAIYATADAIYEPATGERKPLPEGWSKEKAIVAHIRYAERDDEDDCTFGIVPIGGGQ